MRHATPRTIALELYDHYDELGAIAPNFSGCLRLQHAQLMVAVEVCDRVE